MITAGATPTPKTIDQRRVALTSPQVKTLQTDNAGTLGRTLGRIVLIRADGAAGTPRIRAVLTEPPAVLARLRSEPGRGCEDQHTEGGVDTSLRCRPKAMRRRPGHRTDRAAGPDGVVGRDAGHRPRRAALPPGSGSRREFHPPAPTDPVMWIST